MTTESTAQFRTSLNPEHLFHLLMARNWLRIGSIEDAYREFQLLPPKVQRHPEAQEIRQQLFSRCKEDKNEDK
jgi:hypothetical protein